MSSGSSGGSARREAGAVVPDEVSRVLFAEQLLILLAACCVLISVLIFFWRNPNALLFFVGVKILAIVFALRTARDGLLGSVWGLSAGIRQGILLSEEAQQSIYDVVIITSIRRMRMAKKLIRVVLLLTNRDLTREEIHYIIQVGTRNRDLLTREEIHYIILLVLSERTRVVGEAFMGVLPCCRRGLGGEFDLLCCV